MTMDKAEILHALTVFAERTPYLSVIAGRPVRIMMPC